MFGSFGDTENVPVPLTVTVVVNGNNTTNPTGSFVLRLDPDTGEAGLSGLSLDLLGGDEIVVNVTANMLWDTFRTRNPTCLVFGGFTIPVPLGQAVVSMLTAQQGDGEAVGTLVESEPGTYVVAIPVTLSVAMGASFLDTEIPPTPQDVPIVFAAQVTVAGGSATISIELEGFDTQQQQEGPIGDPFSVPFPEPRCGGSLIFNLQLQSLSSSSSVSGSCSRRATSRPRRRARATGTATASRRPGHLRVSDIVVRGQRRLRRCERHAGGRHLRVPELLVLASRPVLNRGGPSLRAGRSGPALRARRMGRVER